MSGLNVSAFDCRLTKDCRDESGSQPGYVMMASFDLILYYLISGHALILVVFLFPFLLWFSVAAQ